MPLKLYVLGGSAFAVVLFVILAFCRRDAHLRNLRGPPSPLTLFGNEYQLFHQSETGELDFQWMRKYGSTWRTSGYFSVRPSALRHILHKSGYNYPKRMDIIHMTWLSFGPGILWSEGAMHQRHRKVMNPAFSTSHPRAFIPLFQRATSKLMDTWRTMAAEQPNKPILVNDWLARSALDIIGQAAFDYDFGALDDLSSPLAEEYRTLMETRMYPDAMNVLYRAIWPLLPPAILKLTKWTPGRVYAHFRRMNDQFVSIGKPFYQSMAEDGLASQGYKKNVMSVLPSQHSLCLTDSYPVRANASKNACTCLGEDEVLAQMAHLTVAAQETTSGTLSWMLYELAQHPEYQTWIREEIRAARARVDERGDSDLSLEELDGMKMMLAAIKDIHPQETLRFHAIAYHLWRVAAQDDAIPLSDPVVGIDGTVINEILISAGQAVTISICGYDRLRQVWGEDADDWNPERFSRIDMDKQVKIGVYSNLMSFSAGLRACIGWRFALYQMQAVDAALLEHFAFDLPADKTHIMRAPGGGVMIPIVKGKEEHSVYPWYRR
ncbi:cytochrome P450 [Fomes fomentarius]|nr:cytochrome P450 [Fomes fomentarius]